ncbi:MAG: M23 family metallopeptidase [Candidatus Woesebacteria bacterium]
MTSDTQSLASALRAFNDFLRLYLKMRSYALFSRFETVKDWIVDLLYRKRGKYARPVLHLFLFVTLFFGITVGPSIVRSQAAEGTVADTLPSGVLLTASGQEVDTGGFQTIQGDDVSRYRGGEVYEHTVESGETLKSIADKYGLKKTSTIAWLNNISEKDAIKPGQKLKILPIDGVLHKVKKGDTICSVARTYGLIDKGDDCGSGAQPIVDYPFNTFTNDEFGLQVGQYLVVPDGVLPQPDNAGTTAVARRLTPNAGAVSATGQFIWPASGIITQGFSSFHRAFDIANRAGGSILAADSGKVIVAGWVDNSGYGNRVMIDHGNGYVTLYAHMSVIAVQVGQTVKRGDVIGQMGSTGRSTGTHCHFEVRLGGVAQNPGNYLK